MIIPKDTTIVCSRKRCTIGTLTHSLRSGGILRLSHVDFEAGQERVQGEPHICRLCGGPYGIGGRIHTSEGWLPDDPVMEPPVAHRTYLRGQVKARAKQDTVEKRQAKKLKKFRKDKKDKKDKDKK